VKEKALDEKESEISTLKAELESLQRNLLLKYENEKKLLKEKFMRKRVGMQNALDELRESAKNEEKMLSSIIHAMGEMIMKMTGKKKEHIIKLMINQNEASIISQYMEKYSQNK